MRYPSIEPELWRSLSEQERGQRQFQYVRKWALVAAACRVVILRATEWAPVMAESMCSSFI